MIQGLNNKCKKDRDRTLKCGRHVSPYEIPARALLRRQGKVLESTIECLPVLQCSTTQILISNISTASHGWFYILYAITVLEEDNDSDGSPHLMLRKGWPGIYVLTGVLGVKNGCRFKWRNDPKQCSPRPSSTYICELAIASPLPIL
jgi:hypothetical protein